MTLAINSTSPAVTSTESAAAIKTAQLAQDQMSIEGKMAMDLIQSAALPSVPAPVGNSGQNINIKV